MYTDLPVQECRDRTGAEPIGTKWVDTNKGFFYEPVLPIEMGRPTIQKGLGGNNVCGYAQH